MARYIGLLGYACIIFGLSIISVILGLRCKKV